MPISRRVAAETVGTFWLVFGGCGSAVLSAAYPQLGIGFTGVALAFGLSVLTMAYAFGHISGAHLNPAVTIGLAAARRFPRSEILPYIVGQVLGAIIASALLYLIASGRAGFDISQGFATNGYADQSPGGYSLLACFVTEFVLTGMFIFIILGATGREAPQGFAPLTIGLTLTIIHLISIPVTNTSVNPARSIGPALFAGGAAISQLWMFILAPVLGAIAGGLFYNLMTGRKPELTRVEQEEERPLKRAASQ